MKKLVSILVILCMTLAMIPALAEEEIIGEWYLSEIVVGDQSVNPSILGMGMAIVLDEDGVAAVVTVNEGEEEPETQIGTWELTDDGVAVTIDEDTLVLVPVDDTLVAATDEEDGSAMVFTREAPEDVVLPETIPAESEEDFFGDWMLYTLVIDDTAIPAALFGLEMAMTIDEGAIAIVSSTEPDEVAAYVTTFEDGALLAVDPELEEITDTDVMLVELNDNGWVSVTQIIDEESAMVLYFELIEEEAE